MKWTLASDVDGTLTGDRASLDRLAARLAAKRAAGELFLIVSTGRRLVQVLEGLSKEGLPEPDAIIGQVGTEIYLPPLDESTEPMPAWRERLLAEYHRDEAVSFLDGIEGLRLQPDVYNTELKTSCYLDECPDPEAAAAEIRRRVEPRADRYQVVWSSGRDLDILPAASGKGRAIRFLVEHLGLDAERVVVAGDTGNDASMFEEFGRGVVVANAQPELMRLARTLGADRVYRAQKPYAAGVEEGLERYGVLDRHDRECIVQKHVPHPRRYHLDAKTLQGILQSDRVDKLSWEEMECLFRDDESIRNFLPDGVSQIDPRDGSVIVFNAARARRPHDNAEVPAEPEGDGASDPVCRGETTGVIDVAPLSEGFTFLNKNLFPVLYPFETAQGGNGQKPCGMHFLQWTSSYFDRDWYNMPQSDRVVAMGRLAALEKKLLLDASSGYPVSGETSDGRPTHGYALIIKNYGRLVGGSLAHGHQQILFSSVKPRHIERNEQFEKGRGETFAQYMLRENPADLLIKDYGSAVLMVPYFMRRPYNMLLVLKDHRKRFLLECNDEELAALAQAMGEVTGAIMAIMPSIGRQTAYNVTLSNGPGAGLYFEFLPYTQETGGLEHLGLWVCQNTPQRVAPHLRNFIPENA